MVYALYKIPSMCDQHYGRVSPIGKIIRISNNYDKLELEITDLESTNMDDENPYLKPSYEIRELPDAKIV